MKKLFTTVAMAFMAVCVNAQSYELTGTTIDNDTFDDFYNKYVDRLDTRI